MKQYLKYMDNIEVSNILHQRLLSLEAPSKRPAWRKYGAAAAALVLAAGIGAWGLSHGGWNAVRTGFQPLADATSVPEIADIGQPDIAYEPADAEAEPGVPSLGGLEVQDGEATSYLAVPYIEYGMAKDVAEMALDWDLPKGCVRRDLTQADFAALFRKEENLSDFLGWSGYDLTGWAAWYEDGSLWGAYIDGYKGSMDHFEFAFTAGDTYPPTCIGYGEGVVNELWWDTPVTAYGYDSEHGSVRRVEFMKGGYGFRFDITSSDVETACWISSLLVRHLCDYETFNEEYSPFMPDALSPEGAVLAHPWEADPDYSVGEPNWVDGAPGENAETPAYNPDEAADPYDNTPAATAAPAVGYPDNG